MPLILGGDVYLGSTYLPAKFLYNRSVALRDYSLYDYIYPIMQHNLNTIYSGIQRAPVYNVHLPFQTMFSYFMDIRRITHTPLSQQNLHEISNLKIQYRTIFTTNKTSN